MAGRLQRNSLSLRERVGVRVSLDPLIPYDVGTGSKQVRGKLEHLL